MGNKNMACIVYPVMGLVGSGYGTIFGSYASLSWAPIYLGASVVGISGSIYAVDEIRKKGNRAIDEDYFGCMMLICLVCGFSITTILILGTRYVFLGIIPWIFTSKENNTII